MTPSPWPRPKRPPFESAHSFLPETSEPRPAKPDDLWIPVRGAEVGRTPTAGWLTIADAGDSPRVYIGRFTDDDRLVWAGEAETVGAYTLWSELAADPGNAEGAGPVLRAVQVVQWRAAHRFCGACSVPLVDCAGYLSRRCPRCEELYMVRLSPVALAAITFGEQILLVRHKHQMSHMWALVSGYLESGESVEHAVRREVREEVGVRLSTITYAGSSPSAFGDPHAVLIAYHAEAADPTLVTNSDELLEARWFTAEEVAALSSDALPPPGVLARQLIDRFAAKQRS